MEFQLRSLITGELTVKLRLNFFGVRKKYQRIYVLKFQLDSLLNLGKKCLERTKKIKIHSYFLKFAGVGKRVTFLISESFHRNLHL